MKTSHAFVFSLIFISLVVVLSLANFNHPTAFALNSNSASENFQITTTPTEDASEIGSTDGILIMGAVIVVIVIVPVLLYKKR